MSFFDYSEHIKYPIYFQECNNPALNELFRNVINRHHSYVKFKSTPTRNIRWLIYETDGGKLLGAIGLSSCVLALKCRDEYIGWDKDARLRNSNKVANNSRFCLIPGATELKNVASMSLKLLKLEGKKRWKEKYGDDLVAIETYVEQKHSDGIHREGYCYKAANWQYLGETSGTSISKSPLGLWKQEDSARGRLARQNPEAALAKYGAYLGENRKGAYSVKQSTKKMVFITNIGKNWRKELTV